MATPNKQYTVSELREEVKKLPKDVQEALRSIDTSRILREVVKKYKLHLDQAAELGSEVSSLMLGKTRPEKFIPNVLRRTNLPKETVHNITEELNEQIFQKIRESLKKIHELSDEENEAADEATEEIKKNAAKHPVFSKLPPEEDVGIEDTNMDKGTEEGAENETAQEPEEDSEREKRLKEKQYPTGLDPYREKVE